MLASHIFITMRENGFYKVLDKYMLVVCMCLEGVDICWLKYDIVDIDELLS
jgi:predicted RNA-binding protein associated with RNAse of E/G family